MAISGLSWERKILAEHLRASFKKLIRALRLNLRLFHTLKHLGNDFFAILPVNRSKLGIEPVQSITGSLLRSSTLHPHACSTMSSNPVLPLSINRQTKYF